MTALTDTDSTTEGTADVEQPAARLEELTLGSLQPHPRNIRDSLGDVSELADSIAAKGVIHPLTVVPANAKGKYRIIAGHRRHAAAQQTKLKRVPCVIRTDLADEADQLAVMLAENTEKADLTLVEEVNAVQGLLELDGTVVKVSARTGMSSKRVRERSKVAKLDDAWKSKLTQFALTLDDGLFIAKHADVPEDAEYLERHVGTPDWGFAKQKIAEKVAARKRDEKYRKEIADAGLIIATGPAALMEWKKKHGWDMPGLVVTRVDWAKRERTPAPTSAVVYWLSHYGEGPVLHEYAAPALEAVDTPPADETPADKPAPAADGTTTPDPAAPAPADTAAPVTDDAPPSKPSPEEEARRQRAADLDTASKVRAQFVADALAKGVDDDVAVVAVKAALKVMRSEFGHGYLDGDVTEFLNIADDDIDDAIDRSTSLPWLATVMAIAVSGFQEHDALTKGGNYTDEDTLVWAPVFEAMGHTWSTVEQQLLKETFDSVGLTEQQA